MWLGRKATDEIIELYNGDHGITSEAQECHQNRQLDDINPKPERHWHQLAKVRRKWKIHISKSGCKQERYIIFQFGR